MHRLVPNGYSRPIQIIVLLLLGIACALMLTVLLKPHLGIVAWLLLVGAVAAPIAIRLAQRRMDVFEPVVFASLVYAAIFIAPGGIMLFSGHTYPLLPSVDLSGGLVVVSLGVLCFVLGYLLVVPRPLEPESDQRKTPPAQWAKRVFVWAIVLGLCGVSLLTYLLYWFPSAGGITQYLNPTAGFFNINTLRGAGLARAAILFASVGFFIAVAHLLLRASARLSDVLLVFLAGLASLVSTALSKNRVFLLWDLGVPVVILHYARRPIRVAELVLGATALFIITVAFTVALRSPAAFTSRTDHGLLANIEDFVIVQTGEMSVVSDIAQRQPRTLGYLKGATLVASAVNVVPRAIWHDKPATAGEIYTRYFLPDIWRAGATFLGVPWQGELLLNGGLPGLIVGSFVSGYLVGLIYRRIWTKPSTLNIALRGLFSFSLFLLITRGSLDFYSFTLVWGVPLVLGMLALERNAPLPPPIGRVRWSLAQQAEFSYWTRNAAIEAAIRSRQASVATETGLFDGDGELSKRLATARRVVEVGAGPAGIIYFLKTPAMRVAVDPLTAQLVEAGFSESFNTARVQAIGEQLPIANESIDVAICYNVLDHCRNPLTVMTEMHRILRPGGTMLLELHLIRSSFGRLAPVLARLDPPHPYHFTREQALEIARSRGFRLELECLQPKGWRRFALRDLISYDAIRHLGSSILTGSVGYFRFARD